MKRGGAQKLASAALVAAAEASVAGADSDADVVVLDDGTVGMFIIIYNVGWSRVYFVYSLQ